MIEQVIDIWDIDRTRVQDGSPQNYVGITTNRTVKKDGCLVMGRGVALQAKQKYPGLDEFLGKMITGDGRVEPIFLHNINLFTFPVKYAWNQKADLGLIEYSSRYLAEYAEDVSSCSFYLPRPGCGNGQLAWPDVKKVIERILPDNVIVVDKP